MPIYAYRCDSCGFAKDVLQKMSDAPLHQCPECGKDAFRKQVTAAGFQLKGSGWYVTDFRSSNGGTASAKPVAGSDGGEGGSDNAAASGSSARTDAAGSTSSTAASSTGTAQPATSAAAASTAAPAAAGTTGSS
ncbi:FmdB family zinc ribbon protein [Paraburkholderia hayleyella]|uniref:FmdB family zinc ribbon protein n=1 Tax=Paraburkholderia hayleyella TaxID=2152889 RepID=UPI00129099B1|nr:FmdB family zinc ribbon protein [Paraburkholderia hayleyella]